MRNAPATAAALGLLLSTEDANAAGTAKSDLQGVGELITCLRGKLVHEEPGQPFNAVFVDFTTGTTADLHVPPQNPLQNSGPKIHFTIGNPTQPELLSFVASDLDTQGLPTTANGHAMHPDTASVAAAWIEVMTRSCSALADKSPSSRPYYRAKPIPPALMPSVAVVVDNQGGIACSGHVIADGIINVPASCIDGLPNSKVAWSATYGSDGRVETVLMSTFDVIVDAEVRAAGIAALKVPVSALSPKHTELNPGQIGPRTLGTVLGRSFSSELTASPFTGIGSTAIGGVIAEGRGDPFILTGTYYDDFTANQRYTHSVPPLFTPHAGNDGPNSLNQCSIKAGGGKPFGWTRDGQPLYADIIDMNSCMKIEGDPSQPSPN